MEKLVSELNHLRAKQKGKNYSKKEAELLLKINQKVDPEIQQTYDELIAKRQAETLTTKEHSKLLKMGDQIEKLEAKRAKYLAELARIRRTSVTALMEELGIQMPEHG